jgi:preprotein translocase subunit SecG
MLLFLLIVHFIICIFLILVVLLQTGTGAQLGAAFGGAGQVNHIKTPENFIGKLTTVFAVVFIISSIFLAILSTNDTSVFEEAAPVENTN